MIEMELDGIRVEMPANAPLILLREKQDAGRLLPIYIGGPEAQSIAYAMEGRTPPRPLTHDLFRDVLASLGATLVRVVVTSLADRTFFAELVLEQGGSTRTVSARPSDAVALAVRTGSPIFCEAEVLDSAGQAPPATAPEESEELVDEFREFLDHINPEDFAG
ncbi:MAG: bifunctional nuclease family protein [Acidimicrobiia bacterium]